jgi:glutamine amidotransferase-like uncharacterized protein
MSRRDFLKTPPAVLTSCSTTSMLIPGAAMLDYVNMLNPLGTRQV